MHPGSGVVGVVVVVAGVVVVVGGVVVVVAGVVVVVGPGGFVVVVGQDPSTQSPVLTNILLKVNNPNN